MSSTATATKPSKVRKNVLLSQDAINKGKALQEHEGRSSFSNTAEAVINREYERVFGGNGKAGGGK
jgi:hypothetical protein